jgi:hypothetical protein
MARIEANPLFLAQATMTLGTDDFADHASAITYTPTPAASKSWTGLGGKTTTRSGAEETWACGITYVQDWETEGSLSHYLHDHAGERVPAVFTPLDGGDPWYSEVTLAAGPIGGTGQEFATGTVTLASSRPSQTAPTA